MSYKVAHGSRIPGGDRPTSNPGGCECEFCGGIFIGAPGDYTCAVCLAREANPSSGAEPVSYKVSPERLDEIADGDEYDAEITSMARELRELRVLADGGKYGEMEG